jgi:hypothetical protein
MEKKGEETGGHNAPINAKLIFLRLILLRLWNCMIMQARRVNRPGGSIEVIKFSSYTSIAGSNMKKLLKFDNWGSQKFEYKNIWPW